MPPETTDLAPMFAVLAASAEAWPDIPGVPQNRSSYLEYLPGVYEGNDFLARFLLIFESILSPLDRTIGNLPHYFDPELAPADLLPWLGGWVGLVLDHRWPEARRRDLVRSAAELYHWRGTHRGLSTFVRLYSGITPEIAEATPGEVAADRSRAFSFTLRLQVPRGQPVDREMLQTIIDIEKPAFAACTLEIVQAR